MVKSNRSIGKWPHFACEQTLRHDVLRTASDLAAYGVNPKLILPDDGSQYIAATGCRSNKGWLTNLVTNNPVYGFDTCQVEKVIVNGYQFPREEEKRLAIRSAIEGDLENVRDYLEPVTFNALERAPEGSRSQWQTNGFDAQLTRLLAVPMTYVLEAENGSVLLDKFSTGTPAGYSPTEMGARVFPIGLNEADQVKLEGILYDIWMNIPKDEMGCTTELRY